MLLEQGDLLAEAGTYAVRALTTAPHNPNQLFLLCHTGHRH